jgi:hypothetical protein
VDSILYLQFLKGPKRNNSISDYLHLDCSYLGG